MSKKLFLFFFVLFTISATIISCEKDNDDEVISKTALPMSPSQEPPPPPPALPVVSSATGSIDASYNKRTKTLNYKVTWQNLTSDSIRGMHIHGVADPGFNAGILQTFPQLSATNTTGYPLKASGTYSGSAYMDGVVLKEEELLANKYYINLHTKLYPGGEIRGQLLMN